MSIKFLLTSLLIFNLSSQAMATPKALELLHKIELNQCLRIKGCDDIKINKCKALLNNKAFPSCDAKFHENPNSSTNWAACIADFRIRHMSGREFGYMMHGETCEKPVRIKAKRKVKTPEPQKLPSYFTAMSLDINRPALYPSPGMACGMGARRTEELSGKILKHISLKVIADKYKQTNAIAGDGDKTYSMMLDKKVHKYGKCYGKKIGTYLRDKGRYKKGDKVENKYGDVLYVVVDCKDMPKPTVCD